MVTFSQVSHAGLLPVISWGPCLPELRILDTRFFFFGFFFPLIPRDSLHVKFLHALKGSDSFSIFKGHTFVFVCTQEPGLAIIFYWKRVQTTEITVKLLKLINTLSGTRQWHSALPCKINNFDSIEIGRGWLGSLKIHGLLFPLHVCHWCDNNRTYSKLYTLNAALLILRKPFSRESFRIFS